MPLAPLRLPLRSLALAATLVPWLVAPPARADEPSGDASGDAVAPSSRAAPSPVAAPPVVLPPPGMPSAVGWRDGALYVRPLGEETRLWPGGLVQLDARGAFGRGVSEVRGADGEALGPRLAVRRARLDLSGEIRRSWSFYLSGDFAGTPHLEYALIDLTLGSSHLTIGRQLVPVGQANRTFEPAFVGFERPLAVRFALPDDKDLGVMLSSEDSRKILAGEAGVFGGDGGRVNADRAVDLAARVVVRPLATTRSIARGVQVGISATEGTRQIDRVSYALAPLTTEGGYGFWRPGRDQLGATGAAGAAGTGSLGGLGGLGGLGSLGATSVLPSGRQSVVDVELRVPLGRFDLRAEYLYTRRNTREALVGDSGSGSQRFGTLEGHSFYVTAGWWLLGSPAMLEAPGQFRATRPGSRPPGPAAERGLLLVLRGEVLQATYDPGSRSAPAGDTLTSRDIKVRVLDAGLNYHAGRHAAVLLHYTYNVFPASSVPQLDPSNLARAPGNLVGRSGAHQLHEVGGRVQVSF